MLAAMTGSPEVRISGALVNAALADEATAALPEGGLKVFLRMLQAATGAYRDDPPEFVVRYPQIGEKRGEEGENPGPRAWLA